MLRPSVTAFIFRERFNSSGTFTMRISVIFPYLS